MKLRLGFVASSIAALLLVCAAGGAFASSMILNEYNAVAETKYLGGATADPPPMDPYFTRVAGNGGDWMEFVVIQDMLDTTGWKISTFQGDPEVTNDATIELPSLVLRSGTILTIAENVPTDLSYNPLAGDWWINFQASFSKDDNTHKNFQVEIYNDNDGLVFGRAGEGIMPGVKTNSEEVFKLEADPSDSITPTTGYNDGSSSTFGAPNVWGGGTITQDFSALRAAVVPEPASILALACGIVPLVLRRRSAK